MRSHDFPVLGMRPARRGWDEPTAAQINNPWPGDPTYRQPEAAGNGHEPACAPQLGAAMIDGANRANGAMVQPVPEAVQA